MRNIGDQKGKDAAKNRRQRDIGHGSLDDEYVQAHRRSDLSDLENAHHDDSEPDRVIAQRRDPRTDDGHGQHDHGNGNHHTAKDDVHGHQNAHDQSGTELKAADS